MIKLGMIVLIIGATNLGMSESIVQTSMEMCQINAQTAIQSNTIDYALCMDVKADGTIVFYEIID